jgi:ubiquinol-cytochrome c reductase cytochrome c1 subunit
MKELKILAVLVFFTGALYIGVEPFAHTQMHKHVEPADYNFKDLKDVRDGKTGNIEAGKKLIVEGFQCQSCHSINTIGVGAAIDLGVMTPDLSSAGYLYNDKYLASFIANPAHAAQVEHKFLDGRNHPMPNFDLNYDGKFGADDAQGVADIVAFLKSISPKKMTNKEVFTDACQRCHSAKYGDFRFDGSKSSMLAETSDASIVKYMGTMPPDLSQMIRSRSKEYLHEFINEPAKYLEGTAMPRVGLSAKSENQVVSYLEEIGDSHKQERDTLAPKFLAYLAIFAIFAWLWKAKIWREIH